MAFSIAGNTITQTGSYFTVTVTAITAGTSGTTLTVSTGLVQAGATTADTRGRLIVNNSRLGLTPVTTANLRPWAFVNSISAVTTNTTGITLTLERYFLSGTNGEEAFDVSIGDQLSIAQCEDDLISAGLAGVISNRSGLNYAGVTGVRTDVDWSTSPTTQIYLGTQSQGLQVIVNGTFGIRGNTQVYQGPGLAGTQQGNTALAIGPSGAFSLGRASTTFVGNTPNTSIVYPAVSWTVDQRSVTHWGQGTVSNNGGLCLFMGTYGGVAATITSFFGSQGNANDQMHYRKCRIWSAGTAASNVVPNIFGRAGYTTFDECEMYGTQGLQREGAGHRIYSISNAGAGLSQAANNNVPPFIVNGYNNTGSLNGLDYRVYQGTLSAGNEATNANMIISKDSPLGTNLYLGSADDSFSSAANQQNGNMEMKRNLNFTHTGANTNSVTYFKDVTRAIGTTGSAATNIANQRGCVALNGTQSTADPTTTGLSITATRSGTPLASDNIQLQSDRTYTQANSSTAAVLIGEVYTIPVAAGTTPSTNNSIGRTGYDGGATGITTTRVSRRGKDDTQGSRLNRDNYDLYTWSYTGQFSKTSDYSMNAGANGQAGTVSVGLLTDTNLTVTNPATVAAYTDVGTVAKLYDYTKYYKTVSGTIDGRTQKQRLELGGVDGSDPTASLANGSGGYLTYIDSNNNIAFNSIFNSFLINGGTNASPFSVGAMAQGPVRGTWNGTTYNYGDCVPAIPTISDVLTLYAGASNSFVDTKGLNFGSRNVHLAAQPTVAGTWAPLITTGNISLGTTGTAAKWTTNNTIGAGTGASTFTVSNLPTALVAGGSVTTGSVNLTGVLATDVPAIDLALEAALSGYGIVANSSVVSYFPQVITITVNTAAQITPAGGNFTMAFTGGNTKLPSASFTGNTTAGLLDAANLQTRLQANATVAANWTVTTATSPNRVILTELIPTSNANTYATGFTVAGGNVAAGSYAFSRTGGGPNVNALTVNFTAPIPAVAAVPTSSILLTSSLATYLTAASATTGLVTGVAGTPGTTNYQTLTYGTLSGLPTSSFISNGGALRGGSWTVNVSSTATGPITWANTAMSGNQIINLPNTSTSIQYILDSFPDNTVLTVNGPAGTTGNRTMALVGCSFSANKTITINYVRGAGSTDNLQIALSGGTPLAGVVAGTNASIVNAVNISLDATSYGGRLMIFDASGNVLSNTVLNATGSTQQILYSGTANRAILGSSSDITAYVPRVYNSTQLNSASGLDGTSLIPTAAPVTADDANKWTTVFASGLTTFLIPMSLIGDTAGVLTAGRIVRRFADTEFLSGLNTSLTAGHAQSDFINNTLSDTCFVSTYLLKFNSSVNTIQRTIGGVKLAGAAAAGGWFNTTGNTLTDGISGATGVPQVATPLNNSTASIGDVYLAEQEVLNNLIVPKLTTINNNVKTGSLLVPASENFT